MRTEIASWLFFRCLRWLLWVTSAAYYLSFMANKRDHLNSFGHLLPTTEFWMFGLPLVALFAGFFELMMREKAGVPRPAVGRNWLG